MGAEACAEHRSGVVIVVPLMMLTCVYLADWFVRPDLRSVVVLGVVGSNPIAHPKEIAGQKPRAAPARGF